MRKWLIRVFVASLTMAIVWGAAAAQDGLADDECPPSQFEGWGMNAVVTPGDANNVRAEPAADAPVVGRIEPGVPFNIVANESACIDGYLWRGVRAPNVSGWTAEIPAKGGEPFIVPYTPEEQEVGVGEADGSITVDAAGIHFIVPAELNVARVTLTPQVGYFGYVMGAQPSSLLFTLLDAKGNPRGDIAVYPYNYDTESYNLIGSPELERLLSEQPSLLEYSAENNRMPQLPIAGVAALIGGAGEYLPFGSGEGGGDGLRYITYFAQNSVVFTPETTYNYLYRGVTENQHFLVTGQNFPVKAPADALPPEPADPFSDAYFPYLKQVEANFAALPSSAFTPDLAVLDALFTSFTFTDGQAVLDLIP